MASHQAEHVCTDACGIHDGDCEYADAKRHRLPEPTPRRRRGRPRLDGMDLVELARTLNPAERRALAEALYDDLVAVSQSRRRS